jgi:hypothetical protein
VKGDPPARLRLTGVQFVYEAAYETPEGPASDVLVLTVYRQQANPDDPVIEVETPTGLTLAISEGGSLQEEISRAAADARVIFGGRFDLPDPA